MKGQMDLFRLQGYEDLYCSDTWATEEDIKNYFRIGGCDDKTEDKE